MHLGLLQRPDLREAWWGVQPLLMGGVLVGGSSIAFAFPCASSGVRPPGTTSSTFGSGSELVDPDPVVTVLFRTCHVSTSPLWRHNP